MTLREKVLTILMQAGAIALGVLIVAGVTAVLSWLLAWLMVWVVV